ncbi:MAG TPA: zinc ABC transporter substrate-binding protein [Rhodanobacteraceae bacterium]|nr:zinc ABC transporter substrate-binding protein [Rhodanobacteraceae bacterium]
MNRLLSLIVFAVAASVAAGSAHAELRVFACEPEWGSMLHELAGDTVSVDVATNALQDPHVVEARPSLIAKVRRADLVVCTGAELEIGWLPQLLRQAGNNKVSSGNGYFMADSQVTLLGKPTQLDRANGDIHADGNPHIQMDPYRMLAVAKALTARLALLDPANAATYQQRFNDFSTRWMAAIEKWEAKAAPLKGRNLVVRHDAWMYFEHWLGLNQIGTLEPKPGVPPTSSHLSDLIDLTKASHTLAIVSAAYQDPKAANWLSGRTGVPAVTLPFTVGGDAAATDLFSLYDDSIDRLLAALHAGAAP